MDQQDEEIRKLRGRIDELKMKLTAAEDEVQFLVEQKNYDWTSSLLHIEDTIKPRGPSSFVLTNWKLMPFWKITKADNGWQEVIFHANVIRLHLFH